MGGLGFYRRGFPVQVGLFPPERAQTPPVAWPQPREVVLKYIYFVLNEKLKKSTIVLCRLLQAQ